MQKFWEMYILYIKKTKDVRRQGKICSFSTTAVRLGQVQVCSAEPENTEIDISDRSFPSATKGINERIKKNKNLTNWNLTPCQIHTKLINVL